MRHKIALISDIHGNSAALAAVVADIKANHIQESWFLGDLFLPGPGGDDLFELLDAANTTVMIRGNWDDRILNIISAHPQINTKKDSGVYKAVLAKFVAERLSPDNIKRMRKMQQQDFKSVNTLNIGLTHNLPNRNYGPALGYAADGAAFDALFTEPNQDMAIYGHIHHQVLRYSSRDQLVVNPGSVGRPYSKHKKANRDRRAQYAILTIDDTGIADILYQKVAYDPEPMLQQAEAMGLPYVSIYRQILAQSVPEKVYMQPVHQINADNHYVDQLKSYMVKQGK
ncbi:metallophosphoesterase [Weissella viridescens]|uniref:Metallophosphoesterase n=1 Tax=Weissella viridescens TaxID=1629 RepID=A0A3P2RI14_WEIVI|nr:metallophosphoesterase family protein [Weissella viridescens]RRG18380.1 metallophosphoesterase [Weissella viridescens]